MDTIKGFFSDDTPDTPDTPDTLSMPSMPNMDRNISGFVLFTIFISVIIHSPPAYKVVGMILVKLFPTLQLTVPDMSSRSFLLFIVHSFVMGGILMICLLLSGEQSYWLSPCNISSEDIAGEIAEEAKEKAEEAILLLKEKAEEEKEKAEEDKGSD
jgi:hypothetical protein